MKFVKLTSLCRGLLNFVPLGLFIIDSDLVKNLYVRVLK